MQRVVNNIFVIFVSEAHFCKAVVRHLAGRSGATGRLNEKLAYRADEPEQRKGTSSAEPPHFRFTKNINRETIN